MSAGEKEVAVSPATLVLAILALWVLLGILGTVLHVVRALLILALVGSLVILILARGSRTRRD